MQLEDLVECAHSAPQRGVISRRVERVLPHFRPVGLCRGKPRCALAQPPRARGGDSQPENRHARDRRQSEPPPAPPAPPDLSHSDKSERQRQQRHAAARLCQHRAQSEQDRAADRGHLPSAPAPRKQSRQQQRQDEEQRGGIAIGEHRVEDVRLGRDREKQAGGVGRCQLYGSPRHGRQRSHHGRPRQDKRLPGSQGGAYRDDRGGCECAAEGHQRSHRVEAEGGPAIRARPSQCETLRHRPPPRERLPQGGRQGQQLQQRQGERRQQQQHEPAWSVPDERHGPLAMQSEKRQRG